MGLSIESTGTLHALPVAYRFMAFMTSFLIPQCIVTFMARRVRVIARRIAPHYNPPPPPLTPTLLPS